MKKIYISANDIDPLLRVKETLNGNYDAELVTSFDELRKINSLENETSIIAFTYEKLREWVKSKQIFLLSKPSILLIYPEDFDKYEDPIGDAYLHDITEVFLIATIEANNFKRRLDNLYARYYRLFKAQPKHLSKVKQRNLFEKKVQEILSNSPNNLYNIVCIDVVRIKLLNDLYGFEKVDKMLTYVEKKLREIAQTENDLLCVNESDIYLFFPYNSERIRQLSQQVNQIIKDYQFGTDIRFKLGINIISDLDLSIASHMDRAKLAANSVKGNYLELSAVYEDSMRKQLLDEQFVVTEFETAIKEKQFLIYIQPKNDMRDGSIVGGEALVRWHHPIKGLISPGVFIPIFERNGFIKKLDLYVAEETCLIIRKWIDEDMQPIPISINISGISFYYNDTLGNIVAMVEKYKIPPEYLEIEITETAYIQNADNLNHTINMMKKHGFKVLIDDFGSGYSSLNTLRNINADILKLDMLFLKDWSTQNPRASIIIETVVKMAKRIGMSIIVEGVETEEQVNYLLKIGCRYAQGYHYAKPMPFQHFEDMLNNGVVSINGICQPEPFVQNYTHSSASAYNRIDTRLSNNIDLYCFMLDETVQSIIEVDLDSGTYYRLTFDNTHYSCDANIGDYSELLFSFTRNFLDSNYHDEFVDTFSLPSLRKSAQSSTAPKSSKVVSYVKNYDDLYCIETKSLIKQEFGKDKAFIITTNINDSILYKQQKQEFEHYLLMQKFFATTNSMYAEINSFTNVADYSQNIDIILAGQYAGSTISLTCIWHKNEVVFKNDLLVTKVFGLQILKFKNIASSCNARLLGKDGIYRWYKIDGCCFQNASAEKIFILQIIPINLCIDGENNSPICINPSALLLHGEQKKMLDRRDPQTGLYDKKELLPICRELFRIRNGFLHGLLLVEIDNFNDFLNIKGLRNTDLLLTLTSCILVDNCCERDYIVRIDSNRFIIFLNEIDNKEIAFNKATNINCQVIRCFDDISRDYTDLSDVSLSIGISFADANNHNLHKLYRKLDAALFKAKEKGGGEFAVFE